MDTDIHTSFVVLTYNRVDALLQVLKGLARQCHPGHEVIIADDGSSRKSIDSLMTDLPRFSCPIKHVWHPDTGFTASRARNLGAINSTGNYLVFLDGDCIPNPSFVEAHEALAGIGHFVNGSRVLLSEKLTRRVVTDEVAIMDATMSDWIRWRLGGDVNKLAHLLYWPSAPMRRERRFLWEKIRSCNFAVWKNDFLKINGFDETFEGWGHEDADLVLRLHNAGLQRINGHCCTEVYHLWHCQHSRSSEGVNYQRVLSRIEAGVLIASKGATDVHSGNSDVVITALN